MWTMGKQVPDELAQSLIAEKYDVDIVTLFPKREEAPAVSIPILLRMEIISSKSRPVDATMVRISRSVFWLVSRIGTLHDPSRNDRPHYYNMESFGRSLSFHLAIGYPF